MDKFKIGDTIVRMVKYPYDDDDGFMIKGRRYTVNEFERGRGVLLRGNDRWYDDTLFKIVPKHQMVLEIINDL